MKSNIPNADPHVYQDKKHSRFMVGYLLVIIIIYLLFFSSGYIIHEPATATPLNEPYSFDEDSRSITLLDAAYSPSQEMMEIKIQLHNSDLDGIEDYYFDVDVLRGNRNKLEIKEVLHTEILTVIQVYHVPPRFSELTLYLAPQLDKVTESNMTSVVITSENYNEQSHIETLSLQDYLIDRLQITVSTLQAEKNENEQMIASIDLQIEAIKDKNKNLDSSKPFLTSAEMEEIENQISANKSQIDLLLKEQAALIEQNVKIGDQIDDAQQIISQQENEKENSKE